MVKKWDKSWAGLQGRRVHPFDEWHFLAELFIFLTDLIREKSLAGQRFLKRLIKSPQGIDCHRILKFVIHPKLLVFRKNGKMCYKVRWPKKIRRRPIDVFWQLKIQRENSRENKNNEKYQGFPSIKVSKRRKILVL